jgi:hypothetical protein
MATAEDLGVLDDPDYERLRVAHGTQTVAECPDHECMICAMLLCPFGSPEHLWTDGCPSCYAHEQRQQQNAAAEEKKDENRD